MKRLLHGILLAFFSLSLYAASPDVHVGVTHFTLSITPGSRTVTLTPLLGEGTTRSGTSDSSGDVTFSNVFPTDYTLTISGSDVSLTVRVPDSYARFEAHNLVVGDWTRPTPQGSGTASANLRDWSQLAVNPLRLPGGLGISGTTNLITIEDDTLKLDGAEITGGGGVAVAAGTNVTAQTNSGVVTISAFQQANVRYALTNDDTIQPSIASLNVDGLIALDSNGGGLDLSGSTLFSITFPLLGTIAGGYTLDISASHSLTNVSFPSLASIVAGSTLSLSESINLQMLSLPALESLGGYLQIDAAEALSSLSLPALTTMDGATLSCSSSTNLESITINSLVSFTNSSTLDLFNCALTAPQVNAVLARLVVTGAVDGSVDMSGGTSAAPTGQGIADKATLIGNGVTVTTN